MCVSIYIYIYIYIYMCACVYIYIYIYNIIKYLRDKKESSCYFKFHAHETIYYLLKIQKAQTFKHYQKNTYPVSFTSC